MKPTDIPRWQAAQAKPQGHVGLAGAAVAAVADGDDVLPALDVFAAGQLHHQLFVHRGDAVKSKVSRLLTAGRRAARADGGPLPKRGVGGRS